MSAFLSEEAGGLDSMRSGPQRRSALNKGEQKVGVPGVYH
jgi:hypothetical protein